MSHLRHACSLHPVPTSFPFLFAIKDLFIPPRLDSIRFLQERRQQAGNETTLQKRPISIYIRGHPFHYVEITSRLCALLASNYPRMKTSPVLPFRSPSSPTTTAATTKIPLPPPRRESRGRSRRAGIVPRFVAWYSTDYLLSLHAVVIILHGLRHRRARYLIYNDSSVRPPRRYIRRPQAIITAGHRETPVVIGFGRWSILAESD